MLFPTVVKNYRQQGYEKSICASVYFQLSLFLKNIFVWNMSLHTTRFHSNIKITFGRVTVYYHNLMRWVWLQSFKIILQISAVATNIALRNMRKVNILSLWNRALSKLMTTSTDVFLMYYKYTKTGIHRHP